MTNPRYTTLGTVREYLSPDGALGTVQDDLITQCILRAESAIDSYTRRNFAGTAGTVLYSRYYADRVRNQAFYLDRDLHTLVGVVNGDGRNIPLGSVWLEPRNNNPPYKILRFKSAFVWVWSTDTDVIVSGTFGFSTVAPTDIQQATVRYAAYLFKQKDVGITDTAGFQEAGEVQYTSGMPQDVRWLLAPYRSRTGGAW